MALLAFMFAQIYAAAPAHATGGLVVDYTSSGTKQLAQVSATELDVTVTTIFVEDGVKRDLICTANVTYVLAPNPTKSNYWVFKTISYSPPIIDAASNGNCVVNGGSFIITNNATNSDGSHQIVGQTETVAPTNLSYQILIDPAKKTATMVDSGTGGPASLNTSYPIFGSLVHAMGMSANPVNGIKTPIDPVLAGGGTTAATKDPTKPDSPVDCNNKPLGEMIHCKGGYVYSAWQALRVVVNLILILALLVISFSNILRININSYAVKKALPNLIIGVILSNASFFIIRLFADLATASTFLFINLSGNTNLADFIKAIINTISRVSINTLFDSAGGLSKTFGSVIQILVSVIAIIGILWLAVIMYVRLIMIYFLAIVSPLAFLTYGLPGLDKWFKEWWQYFIKWMFMLTALCAVFWVDYEICIAGHAATPGGNNSVTQTITCYVIFFFALTIPSKFGGKLLDNATSKIKKYSGIDAAKKYVGDEAKFYGKAAGSWASSKVGLTRYQEWSKLNKENIEKRITLRRGTAGVKAMSGRAGGKAASLAYDEQLLGDDKAVQASNNSRRVLSELIAQRLNASDFKKTTAEKQLERKKGEEKLKFYSSKDEGVKKIITDFARAKSEADALVGATSTEEKIAVGTHVNKRIDLLSRAKRYQDLKRTIDEEDDRIKQMSPADPQRQSAVSLNNQRKVAQDLNEAQYNNLRVEHADLSSVSLKELSNMIENKNDFIQGKILSSELTKQNSAFDDAIEAMAGDIVKNWSVEQMKRDSDYKDFMGDKFDNLAHQLASGNSLGADMKKQQDYQKMIYSLKQWMKDQRNPNYNDAIQASLKLLVLQGKKQIEYTTGQGKNAITHKIGNEAELDAFVNEMKDGKIGQNSLKSLVQNMNRDTAFGGNAASHLNTYNEASTPPTTAVGTPITPPPTPPAAMPTGATQPPPTP